MREPDLQIHLLEGPELTGEGVLHRDGQTTVLLGWSEVRLAVAAEIGEPEGVRTIVFDLVTAVGDGAWLAHRLDADPGDDAIEIARAIEAGVGGEAPSVSIKSLATDGIPTRWYPDLLSFEEETQALLAPYTESRER